MPSNARVMVKDIALDLSNPRTIPQVDENSALETMVSINPSKFWGLMESIINDGYLPTENIVLVKDKKGHLSVKEGNRRIAVLKIALGLLQYQDIASELSDKINDLDSTWKKQNEGIPCVVYDESEADGADRIVALVHAKGEPAGRDGWTAVARSRFDRDKKGNAAPSLDLLELYLKYGRNLTPQQRERWSGDYPITVLHEALPSLTKALSTNTAALVASYPKKNKRILDHILLDIGVNNIGFKEIRDKNTFWVTKYGVNDSNPTPNSKDQNQKDKANTGNPTPSSSGFGNAGPPVTPNKSSTSKRNALSGNDPQSVMRKLKSFKPKGNKREKVTILLNEMKKLKLEDHPHAFCFLLRSVFEISAKVYCGETSKVAGISLTGKNGREKILVDILKDIVGFISNNGADHAKTKELHGAVTELSKQDGLLSVTSMNQLIHNPNFSVTTGDICILFHNIFPLLEEMNS